MINFVLVYSEGKGYRLAALPSYNMNWFLKFIPNAT